MINLNKSNKFVALISNEMGDFNMKSLQKMYAYENNTLMDALIIINKNNTGTAFVVDEKKKLLGTITDGDIRRAIINNISLNNLILGNYNAKCRFLYENYSYGSDREIFKDYIKVIPIINKENVVVDYIEIKDYFNEEESKDNPVLIMAGGLGSRLKPLTDDMPKPMLKVGDKPILQIIIEQFREFGYKKIYISVNYKYDIIQNYFRNGKDFGVSIKYLIENKKLGTAGSITLAKEFLHTPFFVINGDILTKVDMNELMKYHLDNKFEMTIASRKYKMQIPYGVLNVDEACVTSIEEKPLVNYLVSGGIYVLNPEIISNIPEGEYFHITQLIDELISNKRKIGSFPITDYWIDIGKVEDYYKANKDIQKYF